MFLLPKPVLFFISSSQLSCNNLGSFMFKMILTKHRNPLSPSLSCGALIHPGAFETVTRYSTVISTSLQHYQATPVSQMSDM